MSDVLVGGLAHGLAAAIRSDIRGVSVHVVDTGTEVLDWIAGRKCSLLVLDHALPGIGAPDVVRRLTEGAASSAIPVLYCLGPDAVRRGEVGRIERLGVRSFLHHPFDPAQLTARVEQMLRPVATVPPTNGRNGAVVRPARPEDFVEGLAALVPSDTDLERLGRSLTRRMDVMDRAAMSMLEGAPDPALIARARREAGELGGLLGSLGRVEGSRLARDIEHVLDTNDAAQVDSLRLSELVVELRTEMDRPVAAAENSGIGDSRPLLLVLDRNAEFVETLSLEADARGLQFRSADTASKVREALHERPAVVLIDIDTPPDGADWFGLIAELVEGEVPTPVLAATSAASLSNRVAVARAGGHALLRKPVSAAGALDAAIGAIRRTDIAGRRILCVDDDGWTVASLRDRLEPLRIDVSALDDARRFWETMEAVRPDVVLLDIDTRYHSGLELCRVLRGDERWSGTPVMILGDATDPAAMHLAFLAGADDFIAKPLIASEIVTRIANRLERHRLSQEQAGADPLTGLLTRRRAEESLQMLARLASRYRTPFSLASINVDGLRDVNEACGPASADAVLRRLGRLLRNSFRVEDVVGRMGGDNLVLGAFGLEKDDCVRRLRLVGERFTQEPFRGGETEIHVSFSAGVSALHSDGLDLAALLHAADDTLSYAKSVSRGSTLPAGWAPGRTQPTDVVDVVMIERDAPLAGLLLHALGQTGWSTRWFKDAGEAMDALCGPYPKLRARTILLEVDLPGRDGFAVLRALQRDDVLARSRVLMLTARANEPEVLKAFELGAFDHIAKPFSVQVLMQRIRRAIQG